MGETPNGTVNANTNIEFDAARKITENFDRNGLNMKVIEIIYQNVFPTLKKTHLTSITNSKKKTLRI